jgi:hypothetical protein
MKSPTYPNKSHDSLIPLTTLQRLPELACKMRRSFRQPDKCLPNPPRGCQGYHILFALLSYRMHCSFETSSDYLLFLGKVSRLLGFMTAVITFIPLLGHQPEHDLSFEPHSHKPSQHPTPTNICCTTLSHFPRCDSPSKPFWIHPVKSAGSSVINVKLKDALVEPLQAESSTCVKTYTPRADRQLCFFCSRNQTFEHRSRNRKSEREET